MAALNQLGLMKNVRYIGGISGGAWATTSYTYAQNIASDEEYLGEIVDPKDITYEGKWTGRLMMSGLLIILFYESII